MKQFNLVLDDECCYGFLSEIIAMFEDNLKSCPDDEVLQLGLEEAKRQQELDEDFYIYKSWYNPMGAFILTRLVEENK